MIICAFLHLHHLQLDEQATKPTFAGKSDVQNASLQTRMLISRLAAAH